MATRPTIKHKVRLNRNNLATTTTHPHSATRPTMHHGGSPASATRPAMHHGGSPASALVMDSTIKPIPLNDYIGTANRTGESAYMLNSKHSKGQYGGSIASDLVMSNLGSNAETKPFSNGWQPQASLNSLNTYQPSGGARRKKTKSGYKHTHTRNTPCKSHRKSQRKGLTKMNTHNNKINNKANNKTKKNKKNRNNNRNNKRNNKRNNMKGGASDWITSQYSLGPNNNPEATTAMFSQSAAASRNDYMHPPNLGSAGSGYPMTALEGGNTTQIGAPLV